MTDYNDGNWHGWQGGDCPVHPKSEVDVVFDDGMPYISRTEKPASDYYWGVGSTIIAFRVIKPYVEPPKPREVWINEYPNGLMMIYGNYQSAVCGKSVNATTTRWIEVLE